MASCKKKKNNHGCFKKKYNSTCNIGTILRLNKGKTGTYYFTYTNNNQWNAKIYRGVIEDAGRDYFIISDPPTGKRYLLLMANLDWVEIDEKVRNCGKNKKKR